ncbi:class I SAM-dependent methyltransferase [Dyella sp. C11]|uniref:class I SAM-dependent methyltransferase n=1 Tax=Dyella sp. C11 TaxID=2126991 RepID=UPI000D642316|nr:class I SAM-dependent methyltransferase [Dyella sp. C11]
MYAVNRLTHNWLAKHLLNRVVGARLPALHGQVVDLGCGSRPFEKDVLKYASRYIGVDWSNTLHGLSADVIANLNEPLPLEDASFDHVLSFEVIEHLSEPDTMLEQAFRILRHGGELTLTAPFQWWLHEAPWDYQRFTRFGLEHHLRKAGFTDIDIKNTSGFWSMWLLKLNYQLHRLIRGPRACRIVIRSILVPIWLANQMIATWADRIWPEDRETAGYFVTARKP